MGYSLSGQLDLLWRYAILDEAAPLGFGFDRWFVFLFKAGVSPVLLFVLALLAIAVAIWAGYKLQAELKEPSVIRG